jgi:hypothetical protein
MQSGIEEWTVVTLRAQAAAAIVLVTGLHRARYRVVAPLRAGG